MMMMMMRLTMIIRDAMVIMVRRQAFFASPTVRRLRYLCTCPYKSDFKNDVNSCAMKAKVETWV